MYLREIQTRKHFSTTLNHTRRPAVPRALHIQFRGLTTDVRRGKSEARLTTYAETVHNEQIQSGQFTQHISRHVTLARRSQCRGPVYTATAI
jgi:hypothetical protein